LVVPYGGGHCSHRAIWQCIAVGTDHELRAITEMAGSADELKCRIVVLDRRMDVVNLYIRFGYKLEHESKVL
jgi:hypothetical protein